MVWYGKVFSDDNLGKMKTLMKNENFGMEIEK